MSSPTTRLSIFGSLLISSLLFLLPTNAQEQNQRPVNSIAATVNGYPITDLDIEKASISTMQEIVRTNTGEAARAQIEQLRRDTLDDLIDRRLIIQAFDQRGGSIPQREIDREIDRRVQEVADGNRAEFAAQLRNSGLTMASYERDLRDQIIVREMRRAVLGTPAPPTVAQVNEAYRNHSDLFRGEDYIRYRQIFIPKISPDPNVNINAEQQRQLANEVHSLAVNGGNFAQLAREHSAVNSASNGGLVPTRARSELVEWMQEPLFRTPIGGITEIIENSNGFYFFYIENKLMGDMPPIDEIREELENIVRTETQQQANDQWLERLRDNATIEYID